MNYTDRMLWQIIDGDVTAEQRFRFLEDCLADPELTSRYESILYLHELLKATMREEEEEEAVEPLILEELWSSDQFQNRLN